MPEADGDDVVNQGPTDAQPRADAAGYHGFLFADLRGYSAYVEAHGDEAGAALLHRYRQLVRERVESFRGAEIRTEGDSFYVVFESASSAVRCALALIDAAARSADDGGAPIHIGIGAHAGESTDTDEGSVGSAVNIAARVCAVARSGEVLVTDAVRFTSRTRLPARFVRRGRHRLKGIREPVELFRVEALGSGAVASTGRYQLRAWLTRQPRLVGLVAAAAVALVIGVAIVTAAIRSLPGGTRADGSASPSASLGANGTASATSGVGVFPNEDETLLLARLDPAIADHCERANPDDRPRFRDVDTHLTPISLPLPVTAGLACKIPSAFAPSVVYYWSTATLHGMNATEATDFQILNEVGRLGIPAGDCATETPAVAGSSAARVGGCCVAHQTAAPP